MESDRGQRIYKYIMTILVTVLITFIITSITIFKFVEKNGTVVAVETNTEIDSVLKLYRSMLEKEYIGEIDDEKMRESAIKGYIAGLGDPYTEYYTKEEMQQLMQITDGNYVGIGIYMIVDTENNQIVIIKPMEGSPAEEAGIMTGDVIIQVNGEDVNGENITEASNKIKGEPGTKVELLIKRNNEEQIKFEVERRKILLTHVKSEVLENDIGYMYISDFDGGCAEEFKNKYKELEQKGIKSLIIDIRNNGGGVVDEAIEILDLMIDKDMKLLITKDKNEKEKVTVSKNEATINIPIIVITNHYSASASEILAGALQDHNRATIVGGKTYGKGVIQTIHRLSNGSGLKVTTNEYYTPNYNKINKIGITPNAEIELDEKYKNSLSVPREEDKQLNKAIEILSKD